MTDEEYRLAVRKALTRFQQPLRTELADRLSAPPSRPETVMIEFEVHPTQAFRETCPVYAWEVDSDSRCSPFGGQKNVQVLRDSTLLPEDLDFMKPDFDALDGLCDIVVEEIAEWLADAWTAVGGREYFVPGFISEHDDIEFFSLGQGRWSPYPTDPKTGRLVQAELK